MNENDEDHIQKSPNLHINISDILYFLLSKWYWFIISIILFVGIAWYRYVNASFIYSSGVTIMIKTPSGANPEVLERLNKYSTVNISNEILQFKSKRLMNDVVQRLNANVSYSIKDYLRSNELYTLSPVTVSFLDSLDKKNYSFTITPIDKNTVCLNDLGSNNNSFNIELNKTYSTPIGKIRVNPTLFYNEKWYDKSIRIKREPITDIARRLLATLNITQAQEDANILNISIKDISPERADEILNTLISVYNEQNIKDKNQIAINTTNFINGRLVVISNELGGVESELETYKKANQLVDENTNANLYLGTSQESKTQANDLSTQIGLAEHIRSYLINPEKAVELIPSNTGLANMDIEAQISAYNNNKLKRDKLIEGSSDNNPIVLEYNRILNSMHQNIIRAVDNFIVGLRMKLQNTRNQMANAQSRISQVPTQQRHIMSIERQQKIKEELYLYLLNKREESQLSEVMTETNARILDETNANTNPVYPNKRKMLLTGFVEGFCIPLFILILLRIFDTRIKGRKDIEDATRIPFLGEIPKDKSIKKRKTAKRNEVVIKDGRDIVSEAFRIVRTNMDFMKVKSEKLQVVTFSSFNSGVGKTFVSTNLAYSFAKTKKKVILIDLDIRKGTLSAHLRKSKKGITSLLSGNATLDEIIVRDESGTNVDTISAGPIAPNPAELLMSTELDNMIEELKKRYDYIIVDNVPVGIIADAAITNRIADLTIFIIRVGKLNRDMLPELERLYRNGQLKNISLLLNGVEVKKHGYGYNYGYGYGYGYVKEGKNI